MYLVCTYHDLRDCTKMLDSKDLLHNFMRGILAYPYTEALVKGEERGRSRNKGRRREMGKRERK